MFGRTIYLKFITQSSYLGIAYEQKRNNKTVFLNFTMVVLMLLQIFVAWRLFFSNTLHNFICLFYPYVFEQ